MTCQDSSHPLRRRGHKSRLLQINSNYGYIFTIVSYLIGVFIFATIVGQVGNVITNRNANRLEFERLLDGAKTYMRHHKVPGGMKRRVLRWYDYSWSRGRIQGGGDINTALGLLPDKLKTELALHVNLSVLKKVTIFQECQPEFLHDLVLKMKAYIFTPGDLICRKGEIAREMFIIADGILDVISETGRVLTTMKAGDFFGEIGILNLDGLNKRTADVRSVGYSELFSLSREDVLAAMKDYPEAQDILQNLGRKRLMEAKNASKINKSQGRQIKEHESSGDSDNAGKRIVERLRSDVKGLKNALRRSRREARDDEDDADGCMEGYSSRANEKRHSILRRMSHVQSPEEYEVINEGQVPIGVGLPLLQRLKLLKEKQEKDKEEWNKALKTIFPKKENSIELDECIPASQRLVSVKEKDDFEEVSSGELVVTRSPTDAAGVELPNGLPSPAANTTFENEWESLKLGEESNTAGGNTEPTSLSSQQPFKNEFCSDACQKNAQRPEMPKNSKQCNQETSIYVPKANGNIVNSVPKQALEIMLEVPKHRERWNILKKSADETRREMKDAVEWKEAKSSKRSRSISPSDDTKTRKRTLRSTVENLIRERRRSRSLNLADHNSKRSKMSKAKVESPESNAMKKYNSIDDLSPEYSALPLVKKLQILNERQKLAVLVERALVVRSASLDVPDRIQGKEDSLFRSRSLASTIDLRTEHRRILSKNCEEREERPLLRHSRRTFKPEDSFRTAMQDMKQRFISMGSSGSLQSPESNETVERRRLKSILKKLSADDNTSDEDQYSRNRRRRISLSRGGNTDLKKLMRAPTVEGYAARHTKLTKSVTFDRETLSSPTEVTDVEIGTEEVVTQSLSPALLTLQLSNLTTIPIAESKKSERMVDRDVGNVPPCPPEILAGVQEELDKAFTAETAEIVHYEKAATGIGGIVQTHLEAIHQKFQNQLHHFQIELNRRDDIIYKLRVKIKELEGLTLEEERCESGRNSKNKGCSPASTDLLSTGEDSSGNRLESVNAHIRTAERDKNDSTDSSASFHRKKLNASIDAEMGQREFIRREGSFGSKVFEELEMKELNKVEPEGKVRGPGENGNCSRKASADVRGDKKESGGIIDRVTGFRKSSSRSGEFVALEIGSTDSSDLDESGNNDWEVLMLAEELSKNERTTNRLEEVRKLEDDVKKLKEVVCGSNLARFTASELDMLETILEAKDQKISEIASSSSCCDIADRRMARDESVKTGHPPRGRRMGHAVSFDFHDIFNRKQTSSCQRKPTLFRKSKATERPARGRQSFENLSNSSAPSKIRVSQSPKNEANPSKDGSKRSLPSLPSKLRNPNFRASLPILSKRDCVRVSECLTSSVSSSDEACQESCDSIFDGNRSKTVARSSKGIGSFFNELDRRLGRSFAGEGNNGRKEELATEEKMGTGEKQQQEKEEEGIKGDILG